MVANEPKDSVGIAVLRIEDSKALGGKTGYMLVTYMYVFLLFLKQFIFLMLILIIVSYQSLDIKRSFMIACRLPETSARVVSKLVQFGDKFLK